MGRVLADIGTEGCVPLVAVVRQEVLLRISTLFPGFIVIPARDAVETGQLIRSFASGVVLVDSVYFLREPREFTFLSEWGSAWLGVIHAVLDRAGVAALLEVASRTSVPVLLNQREDVVPCLASWAEFGRGVKQSARLLPYLAPRLRSLPLKLAAHTVELIASAAPVPTMKQFAVTVAMDERTVRRWYRAAGIVSWRALASASRALRAWYDMSDHSLSGADVAAKHGFGSSRALARQWRGIVSTVPTAASSSMPTDAEVRAIASRLISRRSDTVR